MKKILVLDDSPFILKIMDDMLTGLNYAVTTVSNGNDACSKIEQDRYDLIITDLNMPVMDGLEFTRKVRTLPNCKFVPIVMLSGEEDSERIAAAKSLGISTFISKPPREPQLRSIMNIILNKRGAVRYSAKLKVGCGSDNRQTAYSSNISLNGLFLETDTPATPGEVLDISFPLPEVPTPISCRARVAWVFTTDQSGSHQHPTGMGMEFIDLQEKELLEKFLSTLT